jgi:hypothetical protein
VLFTFLWYINHLSFRDILRGLFNDAFICILILDHVALNYRIVGE